jgi:tRNA G46 methylase TrmB
LADYAYLLRPEGKLYLATDVEELFLWQCSKLNEHGMFKVCADDMIAEMICTRTDEAQKVIREFKGRIYCKVYERIEFN